jgi:hypothetical protein
MRVLPPFTPRSTPFSKAATVLFWAALSIGVGALYGWHIAIGGTYFLSAMAAGVAALIALSIVLFPVARRFPLRTATIMAAGGFVALYTWPDYLSISIPSLPWIGPMRMFMLPLGAMIAFFLINHRQFQNDVGTAFKDSRFILVACIVFLIHPVLMASFSSLGPAYIPSATFDFVLTATVFIVSAYFVANNINVLHFIMISMLFIMPLQVVIGFFELQQQKVLWRDLIPPGFGGDDAGLIQAILEGSRRAWIGTHRVQSTFSNPLLYGEFLALFLPFVMAFFFWTKNATLKVYAACLYVAIIIAAVNWPQARLAFVGVVGAHVAFGGLAVLRYRKTAAKRSITATVGLGAIPAIGVVLALLMQFSPRFNTMVWGGEAQAGSTEVRERQWAMAIDAFWGSPIFGYGPGEAVVRAGTKNAFGGTVDSYFINVIIEWGALGVITLGGAMALATYRAAMLSQIVPGRDFYLFAAMTAALVIMWPIRSVLSLDLNNVMMFAYMGMVAAYCHKYRKEIKSFSWFDNKTPAS